MNRIAKYVLVAIISMLIVIFLIRLYDLIEHYYLINDTTNRISTNFGISNYLAKAIAIPIVILLSWISEKYFFSFRNSDRQKAKYYFSGLLVLFFILSELALHKKVEHIDIKNEERFFDKNGKALIHYYWYSNGKIELFKNEKIHPTFGTELKEITPEIAEKIVEYNNTGRDSMIISKTIKNKSDKQKLEEFKKTMEEIK